VAKIPELARAEAARLLDMGVVGIQLPRTESRREIDQLRGYIKFPPDDTRASSSGLGNTSYAKPKDKALWYRQTNEETILIAHIETLKGAQNVDEIVSLPDVDICFVGTSDLSVDLGRPGDYTNSDFRAAVQSIFDAAKRHGKVCGIPASDYETAKYWIERGVQFFECQSELDLIRTGAAKAVEELRRATI
jgi:4-hydroxy-2-oxoheptanedioate aldolase